MLRFMWSQRVGLSDSTELNLPFPSSVDHVFSELPIMTHPSLVALYGMAHSFNELNKAVFHVIRLVSFLCLWFSLCLPSDEEGKISWKLPNGTD